MRYTTCRLGVAALLLAGCGSAPRTPTIEPAPALSPRFLELDRAFEALRTERRIPGMSVAVVENGAVTYARGFGFMDGERNRPATPETAYCLASLTKPFSAVVLLRLAELGILNIDRRMTDLPGYPEWCASFAQSGSIFARDLDCTASTTIRQAMSHLVQGTPGERFAYNAAVYSQLQRVAPLVSSRSWRQLMIDYVLDPAGLRNTAAGWYDAPKAHVLSNLAQPRRILDSGSSTISITPIWEVGSGAGLISTVMDIARFDMALDRGALLSPASRAAMWSQATTLRGDRVPYGLGWYVQDYEGERLIWHSGWEPNSYSALYLKVPAKSATLIMLANSEGLWWGNPIDSAEVEQSPFAAAFLKMLWK